MYSDIHSCSLFTVIEVYC